MLDLSSVWPELKVVAKLGEGSFGKVYKCEREELGMKLESAVKVISIPANRAEYESVRKECSSDEEVKSYYSDIVSDFSNEIRMMLMLKGAPNVVSVENFKIVEHEDGIGSDIYICMEYLTCFSEYAQSHNLTEKDVLHLGREICNALAICSEKGIIHRDIKPDNIFIDSYGSFKLGDFGVARRLEGSMSMMSKKGTYSYMAPEVFRGEKYDSRADIYSLGMVLYRLLNRNRDPFVDVNKPVVGYNDRTEAFERRKNGEKLPAPVDASPAVAAIILKACEFNAADRYASVADFRQAIKAVEETEQYEEPTVVSTDHLEETVAANDVETPVNRNVQAGYDDETVVVNTYAKQAMTGDETVIVNRTVSPVQTYNAPPTFNMGYNQQRFNGTDNPPINAPKQKSPKSGYKGIIVAAIAFVLVALAASLAVISFSKEEDPTTKKRSNNVATDIEVENTEQSEITENKDKIKIGQQGRNTVSAGLQHTVAIKSDGTVIATNYANDPYSYYYGQCDVSGWKNIVAVAAGDEQTVGLKADGTVVTTEYIDPHGVDYSEITDVSGWKNIVAVAAGNSHTVGLKSDGTVVAVTRQDFGQCDVENWTDIIAIDAGGNQTIGLKSDGTVVATGSKYKGACDVSEWTDIVAISAGLHHTVGLKSDGTVVAVGDNEWGQCEVGHWSDIVAIVTGDNFTVGLRADGTAVATGYNFFGQCEVDHWTDIVAVAAGGDFTVGLKLDGKVIAIGYNDNNQCEVGDWKNIKLPE